MDKVERLGTTTDVGLITTPSNASKEKTPMERAMSSVTQLGMVIVTGIHRDALVRGECQSTLCGSRSQYDLFVAILELTHMPLLLRLSFSKLSVMNPELA
jgi:hypothetical protein